MTFLPTVIRAEYRGEYRIHLLSHAGGLRAVVEWFARGRS